MILSFNTAIRGAGSAGMLTAALLAAPSASAADLVPDPLPYDVDEQAAELSRLQRVTEQLHRWQTVIGGGAKVSPEYEGSDEFKISPIPYVSMTFADRVTVNSAGISAKVLEGGPFTLSATLGYEDGLEEDAGDELVGLGDVDFGATVGGRIEAAFGAFTAYAEVDKTLGGSEGLLGVAGLDLGFAVTRWLRLGAGASATFADENHMEAYFGVDPGQAARSGYSVYTPGAGIKRVDLTATATVAMTENWFLRGEADFGFLLGDAADSPIVQDTFQPSVMLVLGYRF
ncbi:MipA/OmpV family protein [Amorphus sp. 3PC139-8]|uniref:MipA/OmpV family protein n=1 Tax=Amorphus sp. 3PC139-8 TaxID=2735676 RepID=UPI00345D5585